LVIAVGSASHGQRGSRDVNVWPSLAQIAGHMLDAIFIDTLDMDLERLQRVNQTIARIPVEQRTHDALALRTVETLVIRPSRQVDEIAAAHASELPRAMRFLMRRVGALEPNGARVLSYLLFEGSYCRRLMKLGFVDAIAQRSDILGFLGYTGRSGRKGARGSAITSPDARSLTSAWPTRGPRAYESGQ
jgi:NTE family protein